MIVSDNGIEFTSNAILAWQEEQGIEWHYLAQREDHLRTLLRGIALQFHADAKVEIISLAWL